jgi:hypothetical protein
MSTKILVGKKFVIGIIFLNKSNRSAGGSSKDQTYQQKI